jgi:hypothetical protein
MKNKILSFTLLLALLGLVTVNSCKKEVTNGPTEYAVAVPSNPAPAVDQIISYTGTSQTVDLKWEGSNSGTTKWSVYFGSSEAPHLVASNVATNKYTASVTGGGVFYWQVATVDDNGIPSESEVWSFDVNSNPAAPVLTAPANNATGVSAAVALKWTCTDPENDALTYDVYLGTTRTPGVVAGALTAATYSPTLTYTTKYYWKVVSHDPYNGLNTSPLDSFTTGAFVPDFSVYKGIYSEVSSTFGSTKDVFFKVNTTTHEITMYLPCADGMVAAGWGTAYSGAHPIIVTYDPAALTVTSTKQLWTDSFIDPTEMGPMYLTVASGSTIDPVNKKLSIKWTFSGNAYWGGDYTPSAAFVYTLRVQK